METPSRMMLADIINAVYPLSKASAGAIEKLVSPVELAKKEIFIHQDAYDYREYFVLEGVVRSFLYNPQGEDITLSFFCSNTVLSPFVTRNKQGKAQMNFQALVPTQLAVMDARAFEALRLENTEVRNFALAVLQNELLRKVDKEIGLASLTASERLKKFREDFQQLENRIPHPYIASYLGITNISLSRLRRNSKE